MDNFTQAHKGIIDEMKYTMKLYDGILTPESKDALRYICMAFMIEEGKTLDTMYDAIEHIVNS